jgi:hypothetical protein
MNHEPAQSSPLTIKSRHFIQHMTTSELERFKDAIDIEVLLQELFDRLKRYPQR